MNASHAFPFSRRSILRVAAILVIGYALTAAAIQLWAQSASTDNGAGWVSVSDPSRAGSYGISASDGLETTTVRSAIRPTVNRISIAYRPERDPRSIAVYAPSPETGRAAKPQFVTGLSARGFYSHP
jgi:hypothetical protein